MVEESIHSRRIIRSYVFKELNMLNISHCVQCRRNISSIISGNSEVNATHLHDTKSFRNIRNLEIFLRCYMYNIFCRYDVCKNQYFSHLYYGDEETSMRLTFGNIEGKEIIFEGLYLLLLLYIEFVYQLITLCKRLFIKKISQIVKVLKSI